MNELLSSEAFALLKGAYDIHVHSEPSFFRRSVDDFNMAEQLVAMGMKGAVIKCHEGSSVFRANLTNKYIRNKTSVFGSLVLNVFVGGLNPFAVESEIKLGAKIIFMPTISADNHIKFYGGSHYASQNISQVQLKSPREGIRIIDENGKLLGSVIDIIDIVAENDVCLATGHLSNEEGILLCEEALKRGVKKIIFTHPDFETNRLPLERQVELARKGVFIEKTTICMLPGWSEVSPEEMALSIKAIGAGRCIISSDFGQSSNPPPFIGLVHFIQEMLSLNISTAEIEQMICRNPAAVLGVE